MPITVLFGRIFTAIVLRVVYDKSITDMNDEYVVVAQDALTGVNVAGVPGAFWVEYFPFLKNIPGWVPGVTFKKFAKQ